MAPKFLQRLRKIKKNIQKFLPKRSKYNKFNEDAGDDFGDSAHTVRTESPEIIFTLATGIEPTFEADFSILDKYEQEKSDNDLRNKLNEDAGDDFGDSVHTVHTESPEIIFTLATGIEPTFEADFSILDKYEQEKSDNDLRNKLNEDAGDDFGDSAHTVHTESPEIIFTLATGIEPTFEADFSILDKYEQEKSDNDLRNKLNEDAGDDFGDSAHTVHTESPEIIFTQATGIEPTFEADFSILDKYEQEKSDNDLRNKLNEDAGDDFGDSAHTVHTESPEIIFTQATGIEPTFEADFSILDKYEQEKSDNDLRNFTNYSEAGQSVANSISDENKESDSDIGWYEPRRPYDFSEMAAETTVINAENSELGKIVLIITEKGLALELEKKQNYNAWEEVLMMNQTGKFYKKLGSS